MKTDSPTIATINNRPTLSFTFFFIRKLGNWRKRHVLLGHQNGKLLGSPNKEGTKWVFFSFFNVWVGRLYHRFLYTLPSHVCLPNSNICLSASFPFKYKITNTFSQYIDKKLNSVTSTHSWICNGRNVTWEGGGGARGWRLWRSTVTEWSPTHSSPRDGGINRQHFWYWRGGIWFLLLVQRARDVCCWCNLPPGSNSAPAPLPDLRPGTAATPQFDTSHFQVRINGTLLVKRVDY